MLVTRNQWETYMECLLLASPAYHLMGEGFTDLSESKNPKEYSRQYVHERTERTDVTGYAPSIGYSADVYDDNPVVSELVAVSDQELVGSAAQRNFVSVNLWKRVGADTYEAFRRKWAVIPDGKGDGTDALIYTGNLKAVGDFEKGTFNVTTKMFNAVTAGSIAFECVAGASSGDTKLQNIAPVLGAGNSYVYKVDAQQITMPNAGDTLDHTWRAWNGTSDITATNNYFIALAEINAESACVRTGSSLVVS